MTHTRRQLLDIVSRGEHLRHRNEAERLQLLYAAAGMADSATAAATKLARDATAGDPDALDQYRAATFGRAQARRVLGWDRGT